MAEVIYKENNSPSDAFGHSHPTKWQENQENLLNNEPSVHAELEVNLKQIITKASSQKSKSGLKLILFLISHPKKDVRAFSLGRLYPLFKEDSLHILIIKDLRKMCDDPESEVHKAAENSLDFISDNMYNLMISEMILEIFVEIEKDTKIGIRYIKSSSPHQQSHPDSPNKFKKIFIKRFRQLNVLLNKIIFSNQLEELFPELEDVEDFCLEDISDEGIIPYSEIYNFQWRPTDSIERLANIYAHTFMERGHLHHLKTYLDDEDYHVRRIGVEALITVVNFLLNGSNEKSVPDLSHTSTPYFKIRPQPLAKL